VPARYVIRVFNTVDDIGKDSIDAISSDYFFTYGWFKSLEQQKDFRVSPFYVVAYKNGVLVAFVPCFIDLFDHYFSYGPYIVPFMRKLLNIGSRLGLCQKYVLLCYSPFCFRSKVLLDENSRDPLLLSLIYKKISEISRNERILFSSFLFVSEFDVLLTKTLKTFGYLRNPCPNTLYFDVQWSRFEDYLASQKNKRRKNIKREIKKFRESGLTVDGKSNLEELSERFSVLYANLFRKYNGDGLPYFRSSFFKNLVKFAGDRIKVFTAEKGGEIVAFSLFLRQKDTIDGFMFGFDYNSRTNTDFAYFNLTYYEPIRWAIQQKGIRKIFYRLGAENVKLRVGCKIEKIFSFTKCNNLLIASLARTYFKVKHKA